MKEMSATMIALIVTGILAVVGFVTVFGIVPFAQNNSAKGDLNNIASAQEMSLALQGHYVGTIADLSTGANGVSTGFVASGGVEHALATNTAGDAYVAVTKSASGTYFARINGSTSTGQGGDIDTAMDTAGATTGWASAHGITLPTATVGNGGGQQSAAPTVAELTASNITDTTVPFWLSDSSDSIWHDVVVYPEMGNAFAYVDGIFGQFASKSALESALPGWGWSQQPDGSWTDGGYLTFTFPTSYSVVYTDTSSGSPWTAHFYRVVGGNVVAW